MPAASSPPASMANAVPRCARSIWGPPPTKGVIRFRVFKKTEENRNGHKKTLLSFQIITSCVFDQKFTSWIANYRPEGSPGPLGYAAFRTMWGKKGRGATKKTYVTDGQTIYNGNRTKRHRDYFFTQISQKTQILWKRMKRKKLENGGRFRTRNHNV